MDFSSLIQGAIGQQVVSSAASQLGIDPKQAQTAVSSAVPFLLTALGKNAQGGGAEGISNALNQHNGSLLDNLGGFLSQGGNQQDGLGILGHVLGNKQQNVEQAISQESGLNTQQVVKILAMVAPIVMAYLGKQKNEQNLDANGLTGLLGGLMGGKTAANGISLGGFESLLDQDGDGKVDSSDLMGLGSKLLGGFLKK